MRTLVIVNNRSGSGDAGLYDYVRALGELTAEVDLRFYDGSRSFATLLGDASQFDRVVAAGGDGTVSAVSYALRGSGIPILPYPAGTANLLAMNLGIYYEPRALAETTVSGVPVRFDMGEICGLAENDVAGTSVGFTVIAGAGYDASLIQSAAPMKSSMGAAAYLLGALGNPSPTIAKFDITLDGTRVETSGIAVLVANFGRLQFDIEVTRGADPRDGLFDVAVLRSRNIAELLPAVVAGIFDRAGDRDGIPGIDVYTAARVSVTSDPALRIQYDGDAAEAFTPFTATVLPRATTFLLPHNSPYAAFGE